MGDFVAIGVLPGAAAILGFVAGGPIGGFIGLILGFGLGLLGLYAGTDLEARVTELEEEVETLKQELDDQT